MATPTKQNNGSSWLPYAGLALTIGAMIWQGGQLSEIVHRNTDRIVALETRANAQDALLQKMDKRGTANAVKLDFLVCQAQKQTNCLPTDTDE